MPLTPKGEEIMGNMKSEYGPEKGKEVFYKSANKGTITGVHNDRAKDVTAPQPSTGPMSTKGPQGFSEGLPKTVEPAKDKSEGVGKAMSLDAIKDNAKRIGRY